MKDNNPKKDWLNEIVYRLSRPYILVLALIFTLIPSGKLTDALESGAEFLKIDTDAKAVAMGSAYTAMANGIEAIHYNPSGLAGLKRAEAGFSHTNWLLDSSHDFIGIAMPMGKKAEVRGKRSEVRSQRSEIVMGLGFTRLTNGSMEGRAADRGRTRGFDAYDQSIALGAAKNFGPYAVGGAIKYIQSAIAGSRASAFAVDIGAGRKLTGLPVYVALAVQNLGAPMRYIDQSDPLPLSVSAGLLLTALPGVDLSLDLKRFINEKQNNYKLGMNYNILPGFALRTGYMMNMFGKREAESVKGGFSAGVGLYFLNTGLDYSMSPFGELGNVQKLSVKKKF